MEVSDAAVAAEIGEIIKRRLRVERISQKHLAHRLGISESTLQRSLSGDRSFKVEELLKTGRFLKMRPRILLEEAV